MSWDYAEQSKKAKEFGGPEAYAEALESEGEEEGRLQMFPLLILALLAGYYGPILFHKIKDYYSDSAIKEEIEKRKEKLIHKIRAIGDSQLEAENVAAQPDEPK